MILKLFNKIWIFAFTVYTHAVYLLVERPQGLDFIRRDFSALGLSDNASCYCSIPRQAMEKLFERIPVRQEDAFLDIGSGKGYVLYLANQMGFGSVHGIDLSKGLCDVACKNMDALKISDAVTVQCIDATAFKDLDGYSILFLNNPFSGDVMSKVVRNIEDSLKRKPRDLTIVYVYPCCHQIFDGSLLLHLAEKRFVSIYNPMKKWEVYYYKSEIGQKRQKKEIV